MPKLCHLKFALKIIKSKLLSQANFRLFQPFKIYKIQSTYQQTIDIPHEKSKVLNFDSDHKCLFHIIHRHVHNSAAIEVYNTYPITTHFLFVK